MLVYTISFFIKEIYFCILKCIFYYIYKYDKKFTKLKIMKKHVLVIWVFITFLLNVIGTFTPFQFLTVNEDLTLEFSRMGITFQFASTLFVTCVAGAKAAVYGQIFYFIFGLIGEPVYINGTTLEMLQEPSFGYIIGSIIASRIIGNSIIKHKITFLNFFLHCIYGLSIIHFFGLIGLLLYSNSGIVWFSSIIKYSIIPLPSQLILISLTSFLAFLFRKLL